MKTKVIIGTQTIKSYLKFEGEEGYIDAYIIVDDCPKAVVVTKQGIGFFDLTEIHPLF